MNNGQIKLYIHLGVFIYLGKLDEFGRKKNENDFEKLKF